MPTKPAIIRKKLPESSIFKNIQNWYDNENNNKNKLINSKNNDISINKKVNSPINKKTVHFTEAKKNKCY